MANSLDKKKTQLGMHPSTASGRLVKDLLYKFIVQTGSNNCFRCGEEMTRESFSIEHKETWLDSENPRETFFDLDNISFSHLTCNTLASKGNKVYLTDKERKAARAKQTAEWKLSSGYTRTLEERKSEYQRRKARLANKEINEPTSD